MAAVGVIGVWAGEAWLFPSLGPTIFLQVVTPEEASARPWNTLAGHAVGVGLVSALGEGARRRLRRAGEG